MSFSVNVSSFDSADFSISYMISMYIVHDKNTNGIQFLSQHINEQRKMEQEIQTRKKSRPREKKKER